MIGTNLLTLWKDNHFSLKVVQESNALAGSEDDDDLEDINSHFFGCLDDGVKSSNSSQAAD